MIQQDRLLLIDCLLGLAEAPRPASPVRHVANNIISIRGTTGWSDAHYLCCVQRFEENLTYTKDWLCMQKGMTRRTSRL